MGTVSETDRRASAEREAGRFIVSIRAPEDTVVNVALEIEVVEASDAEDRSARPSSHEPGQVKPDLHKGVEPNADDERSLVWEEICDRRPR